MTREVCAPLPYRDPDDTGSDTSDDCMTLLLLSESECILALCYRSYIPYIDGDIPARNCFTLREQGREGSRESYVI